MSNERINRWNIGYDLDCGGYSFEAVPEGHPLCGIADLAWNDPDLDYLGLQDSITHDQRYGGLIELYIEDNDGHYPATDWPVEYIEGGRRWERVAQGGFNETDHECHCRGKIIPCKAGPNRETIEPAKVLQWLRDGKLEPGGITLGELAEGVAWDFTGNYTDKPHPECERCEGDGFVDSPGGCWAIYRHDANAEEDEVVPAPHGLLAELREAAEACGRHIRSYSGRGMYGKCCASLTGDLADLIRVVTEMGRRWERNAYPDGELATLENVSQDQMGLDRVYYWIGIPWPDEADDSDDEPARRGDPGREDFHSDG